MSSIGQMNETGLHEQLKHLYADGAPTECEVDGFVVDVLRDGEIVEIQTRNFGALRNKITRLAATHRVRIVHPIASRTVIEKSDGNGAVVSRRKSPKRGAIVDAFREITTIADLLPSRRIVVEIVLVEIVEERVNDGRGSWRRRGVSIAGRHLEQVVKEHRFATASDYLAVLPKDLTEPFTNSDLAEAMKLPYRTVQPVTSALRKMGLITIAGKHGRRLTYTRTPRRRSNRKAPRRTTSSS